MFTVLGVVLALVVIGSGVLVYLSLTHISSTAQSSTTGHAFFVSSDLISAGNNQGITDELHISLQNVQDPEAGKSYYGWLMSTVVTDTPALALGSLPVNHGQITFTFKSAIHSNLLANYNIFLVTEEDASQQPTNPAPNKSAWSYYAAFSTAPDPTDSKHYSLFDHLKHLLSQDPKLASVGLTGGLDVWLYRNASKILEAAGSARDNQKLCVKDPSTACTDFVLRQVARILDYLDGSAYVHVENIPSTIQGPQLLIDPTIARVALLEFDTVQQQPPGYLNHIGTHLQDISQIAGATAGQRALAIQIDQYINNVQGWLDAVHAAARSLIHMTSAQLIQPDAASTLNTLFNNANAAFIGQVDPNTNDVKGGVVQIHYDIQALATFDIVPCAVTSGQSSCA